jgi:hypothetical protein
VKKTIIIIVFLLLTAGQLFADDMKKPAPPQPPAAPAKPVVPGAAESVAYPRFPSFPSVPVPNNNQTNRSEEEKKEVENYELNVSGAFPNGDTRRNVAKTIKNAQYIRYSDGTIALKMFFTDGSEYIYHLRNSHSKIEIGTGVFRETFETVVQAGKELLTERYSGELSYNKNAIISFNLIGGNKVVVLLVFTKKT